MQNMEVEPFLWLLEVWKRACMTHSPDSNPFPLGISYKHHHTSRNTTSNQHWGITPPFAIRQGSDDVVSVSHTHHHGTGIPQGKNMFALRCVLQQSSTKTHQYWKACLVNYAGTGRACAKLNSGGNWGNWNFWIPWRCCLILWWLYQASHHGIQQSSWNPLLSSPESG